MVKLKEVVAFKHQTERSDRHLKMVLRQALTSATIPSAVKDEPAELLIKVEIDPPAIVHVTEDRDLTSSDIDEKPDDLLGGDSSNDSTYVTPKTEVLAKNNRLKMSRKLRTAMASSMRQTKEGQHILTKPHKQKKSPKLHMKLYACAHCKRVCKRRHRFMEHLTVHGFPVKFPCTRCGQGKKAFKSNNLLYGNVQHYPLFVFTEFEKDAMKEHVRLQHSIAPEEHLCPTCGKTFSKRGTLRAHLRRHNDQKPFQCTECPQGFATKIELQTHTYKHTGEIKVERTEENSLKTTKYIKI